MRHKERSQLGIALAASVLCLTSGMSGLLGKHTVSMAKPAENLMTVCHVNFTMDHQVVLYEGLSPNIPIGVVTADVSEPFQKVVQALHEAPLSRSHGTQLKHLLIVYDEYGTPEQTLYVTDKGDLYDGRRNCYFRPDWASMSALTQRLRTM